MNRAKFLNTLCGKRAGIFKGMAGGRNTDLCLIEVDSIDSVKNHSISARWDAADYLYQFLTSPPASRLAQRSSQFTTRAQPSAHWIGGWFGPKDRSGHTTLFLSGIEPRFFCRPDLSQIIMPKELLRQFKFYSRLTIGQAGGRVGDVLRKSALCFVHMGRLFSSKELSLWRCLKGNVYEITRLRNEFSGTLLTCPSGLSHYLTYSRVERSCFLST